MKRLSIGVICSQRYPVVLRRIVTPFQMCGHRVCLSYNDRNVTGEFDFVFVHAMYHKEIAMTFRTRHLIPFDVADGTNFHMRGVGYYSIADRCRFYAKMNFDADEPYNSHGHKHIALPQIPMLEEAEYARKSPPPHPSRDSHPDVNLIASPSALTIRAAPLTEETLGKPYVRRTTRACVRYSQRLQWFQEMRDAGIRYEGGIVFPENPEHPLSRENQETLWKTPLSSFSTPRRTVEELRRVMLRSPISLCPTGNERVSFRLFQIMSTGSVPVTTRFGAKRMLLMPEYYCEVDDFQNVAEVINEIDLAEALKSASINQKMISAITPESLTALFLSQLTF